MHNNIAGARYLSWAESSAPFCRWKPCSRWDVDLVSGDLARPGLGMSSSEELRLVDSQAWPELNYCRGPCAKPMPCNIAEDPMAGGHRTWALVETT